MVCGEESGLSSGATAGIVIAVLLAGAGISVLGWKSRRQDLHAQPSADLPVLQGAESGQTNQFYTEPVAGQADIYDAEAARGRLVSVREQSSVTGASVVYAIPTQAAGSGNGLYVDDNFYAPGAPGASGAAGEGAYVDDGFYAAGGAGYLKTNMLRSVSGNSDVLYEPVIVLQDTLLAGAGSPIRQTSDV